MAGISGMGSPKTLNKPQQPLLPIELPKTQMQSLPQEQAPVEEVPSDNTASMEALFAEMGGAVATPAPPTTSESMEQLFNQMTAEANDADAGTVDMEDPTLMEQVEQAPVRMKASFARNDSQKLYVLEQSYGKENVKKSGDDYLIKKGNKWKKFDSDSFEIIGDIVDWTREGVEEIGATIGTAVGLGAAGVSTVGSFGAAAPAAPAIIAGARGVGAATGIQGADLLGEWLGVPTTLNRGVGQRTMEMGTAVLGAGVFGRVADNIGAWFTNKAAQKVVSKMDQNLKEETQVLTGAAKELNKAGLINPIQTAEGGNVLALPQHFQPSSPDIVNKAQQLTLDPEFRRVQDGLVNMVDKMSTKVKNFLVPDVTPSEISNLGGKFIKYADDLTKAEGKQIEIARTAFSDSVKGSTVAISKTKELVQQMTKELGMEEIGSMPDPQVLINKGLAGTEAEAKKVATWIRSANEYINLENSGKVTAKELDDLYSQLGKAIRWDHKGTVADDTLKNLWRSVRDDYTDNILTWADEGKLKGIDGKGYKETLARYKELKDVAVDLRNVLIDPQHGDATMSGQALANGLFQGKKAMQMISAFKTLTANDPKLFKQVRAAYIDGIMTRAAKTDSKGKSYYDVAVFAKNLLNLPPEIREEVIGDKAAQRTLKAVMTYSNRIRAGSVSNLKAKDETAEGIAKMATFMTNYAAAKLNAGYDIYKKLIGQDTVIKQYLNENGFKEVLKLVPTRQRNMVQALLEDSLAASDTLDRKTLEFAQRAGNLGVSAQKGTKAAAKATSKAVVDGASAMTRAELRDLSMTNEEN